MPDTDSSARRARADLAVFRAVLTAGVPITDHVFQGLWRWFHDVELVVPLSVMDINEGKRPALVAQILTELDAGLHAIQQTEENPAGRRDGDASTIRAAAEEVVNSLWKELAGCYAAVVNAEVPVLPTEIRLAMEAHMLQTLATQYGVDEDAVRSELKTNGHLRMSIRMTGLDPDRIS